VARDLSADRLMPAVSDSVWREQDTTPSRIEAALRGLLKERFAESAGYAPARALNMVCIVDREWSGEIANRLGCGFCIGERHGKDRICTELCFRFCAVEVQHDSINRQLVQRIHTFQSRQNL